MIDLLVIRCVRLGTADLSGGGRHQLAIGGSLTTRLLQLILDEAQGASRRWCGLRSDAAWSG